ncbi:E3 ubiquitin-protein ligase arih1-like isoform X2 [Xenia sp. Carnegie-2017]|uniref:E3 ubiquitin-protein ligase arih1-like isoform X2 n=1 Tax=Xenia sp. Carnegie-2017 TaxID=2897299 RepID=UPI001F04F886|nr:E3 ubiquitin-protein ligase arih1-like isoform X2 [Xenia sp. Carnegie-2017]
MVKDAKAIKQRVSLSFKICIGKRALWLLQSLKIASKKQRLMDSDEDDEDEKADDSKGLSPDQDEGFDSNYDMPCFASVADDFTYEVLTPDTIVSYMNTTIDDVNNVIELSRPVARILLSHFKWDKEKLLERFYCGDQETLFREAHLVNPMSQTSASTAHKRSSRSNSVSTGPIACDICLEMSSLLSFEGLECGHKFCLRCWKEYLTSKIMDEQKENIACPAVNCDILANETFVGRILSDQIVKRKYHHLIAKSFVVNNRLIKWCRAPDCMNAVKASYTGQNAVTCLCGHEFCFGCGEPIHEPVNCSLLKKWMKKCNDNSETANWISANTKQTSKRITESRACDNSETANWISANTKECPKCQVTIEKNGGCNHMVCRNNNCKADFCWVCLGPWEPHGSNWYSCNRYDEKDSQNAREAQNKSRSSLERYLFYCNRYMNHIQSAKLEFELDTKVKSKMNEMQKFNMSEVQFLKKAVKVLSLCRNTLKYTYVFAFYLRKNNQAVIFEDNQKDLEMATETLSEYLERDISSENLSCIKQKVQDKYRYCEMRRNVLLDHVKEGYERDFWIF